MRQQLADQYNLGNREPNIQVWQVNTRDDRALTLRHTQFQRRPLNQQAQEVLKHVARLWGFDVRLETVDPAGQRGQQPRSASARSATATSAAAGMPQQWRLPGHLHHAAHTRHRASHPSPHTRRCAYRRDAYSKQNAPALAKLAIVSIKATAPPERIFAYQLN